MNALLFFTILALASPIFGDDSNEASKRQEKRGVVNLGYAGGHYPAALGAHGLAGYGAHGITGYGGFGGYGHGYGHGYVPTAPLYPFAHGIGHGVPHGIAAAPAIAAHSYAAPALPAVAHYSHAYNQHAAPLLAAAPWRTGYNGLHGAGFGHGLGYVNGW